MAGLKRLITLTTSHRDFHHNKQDGGSRLGYLMSKISRLFGRGAPAEASTGRTPDSERDGSGVAAENEARRKASETQADSQADANEARRQASDDAAREQAIVNEARRQASDSAARSQTEANASRHRAEDERSHN